MPNLYTIGTGGKSAEVFFRLLEEHGVRRVIDIRLRNTSQLAGYTKMSDLPFFLKRILRADYVHEPLLAPTDELLDGYKQRRLSWPAYERAYRDLIATRDAQIRHSVASLTDAALLCAEPSPVHCHRRVAAEYLAERGRGLTVVHLQ